MGHVESKLVATFKASYKDFRLRARFRAIKDTGNFEKYLHDFRFLSNQISPDDLTEKDRLDVFIQGLRPRTQGEMFMRNVKNLEEAILLATTLENIVSTGPRTSDVNFVKVNKPQFDRKPPVKLFLGKCNKCQRVGHKEANCYKNKQRPTFSPTKTPFRPNVQKDKINISQVECYKCHKRGHFASKCGKPSSTSQAKFYNKPVQSNIVEVNMIEFLEPEPIVSTCKTAMEAYQTMYEASCDLANNWLKYDFFVFNVVCHDLKDFCTECLSLNAIKDRQTQAPQTCEDHWNFLAHSDKYPMVGVRWDHSVHKKWTELEKFDLELEQDELWRTYRRVNQKLENELCWSNYDNFVLKWCIENQQEHDFCYACDDINAIRNREQFKPGVCPLHARHSDWSKQIVDICNWERISNREARRQRKARIKLAAVKEFIDEGPNLMPSKQIRAILPFDFTVFHHTESSVKPTSLNVVEILSATHSSNSFKLLKVQGVVNGTDSNWTTTVNKHGIELTCGLDTGATHSIMSFKAAVRHGIMFTPSEHRFKTADGVIQQVTGETKELIISVQGSTAKIKFMVIDHADYDILLGLDWFTQTNCGFYPGEKILKFPKLPKYVQEEKEENDSNETVIDLCLADVPDEIYLDNDISWELSDKMDIQPTAKLNPTQLRMFEKIKGNIKRVVATDINSLGTCKDFTHKIRTTVRLLFLRRHIEKVWRRGRK